MSRVDDLIQKLAQDKARKAALPHPFLRALPPLFVCLALSFLMFVLFDARADIQNMMQSPLFLMELAMAWGLGISGMLAAIWLTYPDIRQQPAIIGLPFVMLLGLMSILGVYAFYEGVNPLWSMEIKLHMCVPIIAVEAFIPAIFLIYMLRRGASTHLGLAGFMAMLSVLGFAYVPARLTCPGDHIGHLITNHFLPVVLLAMVGIVLGRKFLRW